MSYIEGTPHAGASDAEHRGRRSWWRRLVRRPAPQERPAPPDWLTSDASSDLLTFPDTFPDLATSPQPPQPPDTPPYFRPALNTFHHSEHLVFRLPAEGDGFDFTVDVFCEWCAEGHLEQEQLIAAVRDLREKQRERIPRMLRPQTRAHPPHLPEAAEQDVNALLGQDECFDNGTVRCTMTATVTAAEEIRVQQRAAALRLQAIEEHYAESRLHARELRETTAHWAAFLREGFIGSPTRPLSREEEEALLWLTPWAVRLAETPREAGNRLDEMYRQRQKDVREYVNHLNAQLSFHQKLNVHDFVLASERILGQVMRQFGLAEPSGAEQERVGDEPSRAGLTARAR